jgi:hypothetical protein
MHRSANIGPCDFPSVCFGNDRVAIFESFSNKSVLAYP